MAKVYCACVLSSLEGLKGLDLPTGDGLALTEGAIDKRLRQLEPCFFVNPPPPMLEPSWDSLMWRVCRLARKAPQGPILQKAPRLRGMASLSLLRCVVGAIDAPARFAWPEKEADMEEEVLLGLVGQWLFHAAGQRRFYIKEYKTELEDLCFLALDLSLESELTPHRFVNIPGRYPGHVPGLLPPPPLGPRAACCGCCSCYCHKNGRPRRGSGLGSSITSYSACRRRSRWRFIGWLKKLAFWRKKSTMDDASSTTSTIVSC
ncbi:hypothetical protein GGS23DRAFT_7230 [Durotheca rogersii]|uniref:uncharacterized protein n=1 Tax=Durotheca rogersii TaxID=419775 RepID=UPI00221FBA14|nr:uncharacterized protein GGS23DRAFT_7230 [Durotheca rogersii]KAI5868013.1 hypothetical protein GGS23DRAFT_7230 [Durotheca rogersii]